MDEAEREHGAGGHGAPVSGARRPGGPADGIAPRQVSRRAPTAAAQHERAAAHALHAAPVLVM